MPQTHWISCMRNICNQNGLHPTNSDWWLWSPHSPTLFECDYTQLVLYKWVSSHAHQWLNPPFHLPSDKTRALRIQLTPTYSIEDRFISSLVAKFETKETLTVHIINNKCRKEGVWGNDIVELPCTERTVVLQWRTHQFPVMLFLGLLFIYWYKYTVAKLIAIQRYSIDRLRRD